MSGGAELCRTAPMVKHSSLSPPPLTPRRCQGALLLLLWRGRGAMTGCPWQRKVPHRRSTTYPSPYILSSRNVPAWLSAFLTRSQLPALSVLSISLRLSPSYRLPLTARYDRPRLVPTPSWLCRGRGQVIKPCIQTHPGSGCPFCWGKFRESRGARLPGCRAGRSSSFDCCSSCPVNLLFLLLFDPPCSRRKERWRLSEIIRSASRSDASRHHRPI